MNFLETRIDHRLQDIPGICLQKTHTNGQLTDNRTLTMFNLVQCTVLS